MKHLLLLISFYCLQATAQNVEGTKIYSGTLSSDWDISDENGRYENDFWINLEYQHGIFIHPKIALGGIINNRQFYNTLNENGTGYIYRSIHLSLGPFIRYHLFQKNKHGLAVQVDTKGGLNLRLAGEINNNQTINDRIQIKTPYSSKISFQYNYYAAENVSINIGINKVLFTSTNTNSITPFFFGIGFGVFE